jgi:hypothetical protein
MNVSVAVNSPCNPGNTFIDQVKMETGVDIPEEGDSGALMMVQEPGTDDWFAAGSQSLAVASEDIADPNYAIGPQGFSIRNEHNIWWDDL